MNFIEEEFVKDVIKASIEDYKAKNNDDYEFNEDKCDKMNDIIAYCQKLEREYNCKIIRCMIEPRHEQGYIEVLFDGELAIGEKESSMNEFVNAIGMCDGINISTNPADEDFFQITFFVDNLWIRKTK